jgi:AcrR family transcriptional regulator
MLGPKAVSGQMTATPKDHPTRRRLVKQATKFMKNDGALPSVSEVASAAKISRQTAYRYFPTADELAAAATMEALRPQLASAMENAIAQSGAERRLGAVARAMAGMLAKNEPVIRALIRATICRPEHAHAAEKLQLFSTALEPLKDRLGEAKFDQLLAAAVLALSFGGMMTMEEACDASNAECADIAEWIARALVRQALEDAAKPSKR